LILFVIGHQGQRDPTGWPHSALFAGFWLSSSRSWYRICCQWHLAALRALQPCLLKRLHSMLSFCRLGQCCAAPARAIAPASAISLAHSSRYCRLGQCWAAPARAAAPSVTMLLLHRSRCCRAG
jgi:hypothetical protein